MFIEALYLQGYGPQTPCCTALSGHGQIAIDLGWHRQEVILGVYGLRYSS